jgi:hypothetical protein
MPLAEGDRNVERFGRVPYLAPGADYFPVGVEPPVLASVMASGAMPA